VGGSVATKADHQPHLRPLFCSFSHFDSGSK
jgi:hypothetical protein